MCVACGTRGHKAATCAALYKWVDSTATVHEFNIVMEKVDNEKNVFCLLWILAKDIEIIRPFDQWVSGTDPAALFDLDHLHDQFADRACFFLARDIRSNGTGNLLNLFMPVRIKMKHCFKKC
ncbi:hypothetical protein niasHT_035181 [Heterodera trifolii]|uniref:CCHC-type domain-containing protein n=1 Tax=Heterodera trifolii TaxID=157864 RepID=A0ABD2J322_9BILA